MANSQESIVDLCGRQIGRLIETTNQFVESLEATVDPVGICKRSRPVSVHGPDAVSMYFTEAQTSIDCSASAAFYELETIGFH